MRHAYVLVPLRKHLEKISLLNALMGPISYRRTRNLLVLHARKFLSTASNMVDVDKAVIARIKKEGHTFEILVDCDKALEFKKGKSMGIDEVVATDDIFTDVKRRPR